MTTLSKWVPTTDLMMLRRMGKLGEELGELSAVASRVIIQGLDEIDPSSGKTNRLRLEEELADVQAQLDVTRRALRLRPGFINERVARKVGHMREWEAMFKPVPAPSDFCNNCDTALSDGGCGGLFEDEARCLRARK